tara:strand:+ start:49 stop:609 length:561 start_codon:yes stop_codon:yes gene_type:complete
MWWEILKRQVASTKGKQFQLDFTQPMIEDDNCKKQLSRLHDKVRAIKDKQSFQGPAVITERSGVLFRTINMTRGKKYLDLFPEEICCKVLETFKSAPEGNDWIEVSGLPEDYSAHVVKIKHYGTGWEMPAISGSKIFMEKHQYQQQGDGISDEGLFSIDLGLQYQGGSEDKFEEVAAKYLNEVFSL